MADGVVSQSKVAVLALMGRLDEGGDVVEQAHALAQERYGDLLHPAGKPYIEHVSEAAAILADSRADATTIAAALLCYLPVAAGVTQADLHAFPPAVIDLVGDVLKLYDVEWHPDRPAVTADREDVLQRMVQRAVGDAGRVGCTADAECADTSFQKCERQAENLIRLLLAVPADPRAVVIRVADFLQYLRTVEAEDRGAAELPAQMALTVYSPLADRLGVWRIKQELDELSFRILQPEEYGQIARVLEARHRSDDKMLGQIIVELKKAFDEFDVRAEITHRRKHIYSIYRKMRANEITLEQVNDLLGIRIVVDTVEDCYNAQSVLHMLWPPVTQFYDGKAGRDWIANPKPNLYQSLHTTVQVPRGKLIEAQVRTQAMHDTAEYGAAAAHWRYKEQTAHGKGKTPSAMDYKDQMWSAQLAEARRHLEGVHPDANAEGDPGGHTGEGLFKNWVYVITPKGHVLDFPAGATPVDFAYRIHSDLGDRCMGAKVNGKPVRLEYRLQNGDLVEIMTSGARKGPSAEWLVRRRDDEGGMYYQFARTGRARSKIRQWLRLQQKEPQR